LAQVGFKIFKPNYICFPVGDCEFAMSPFCQLFACISLLLARQTVANDGWEATTNEEGRNVQQLKIQAPSMTEEDQYGYTMPEQYRCDSCKVVAHHVTEALKKKQPMNKRMPEWEYHELFDEVCATGFEGYGVALVNGENMLSGPAIKRDNLEPGMGAIQMGGDTWAKRLGEQCRKFVYEKIGEDEVYDHFRAKGEVSSDLCFRETRDCKAGAEAPQKVKKSKKSKKEKSTEAQKPEQAKNTVKAVDVKKDKIDFAAFISQLAQKHGVAAAEYTKKRSFAEWEVMLSLATKRMTEKQHIQEAQVLEV